MTLSLDTHDEISIANAVRSAVQTGVPLVDYGIAHEGLGHPPPEPHTKLVQHGDVLEHYERDLTIRVASGCTIGKLQTVLAQTNQFLPTDADDDLTIGEMIQHNVYGPLRTTYGGPRDWLLGLSYINGQGHLVAVGGRTVKNVAGYDVTRFLVGSLGELGIIAEVTMRTFALPTTALLVQLSLQPTQMDLLLPQWGLTDAAPSWISAIRKKSGQFRIILSYLGSDTSCQIQFETLQRLIKQEPEVRMDHSKKLNFSDDCDQRASLQNWRRTAAAVVKIIVPPASTGFICDRLLSAHELDSVDTIVAHPLHGCIFVGGPLQATQARCLDDCVLDLVDECGGFRIWIRRPAGAESIEPFAPPQPDWSMLQKLKRVFDPHGVLNPNRFLRISQG